MAPDAHGIIDDLREKIRRIERRLPPSASCVSSGWAAVDALLPGGGFPRGAFSELSGGRASGKMAVALSTLARGMGEHGLAAFVDGRGELYPPAATALGVDLARLLVVRPYLARGEVGGVRAAFWAGEALLASGAFGAVAIEIPLGGARAGGLGPAALDAMLRRLRAAAEKGGSVALWLGTPGGSHVPSAVRLELSPGDTGWKVRRAFARGVAGDAELPAVAQVHHAA